MTSPAATDPDAGSPAGSGSPTGTGAGPLPDPAALLDEYTPGDFYFSTDRYTMLGAGGVHVGAAVPSAASGDAVRAALREAGPTGGRPARVVGAVPFDTSRPARLAIPERLRIIGGGDSGGPAEHGHEGRGQAERSGVGARGELEAFSVTAVPSPEDHIAAVDEALSTMHRSPELHKLVLARTLHLRPGEAVDPLRVLRILARRHPEAYTFAAEIPGGPEGGPRALVGASPELLAARRGDAVRSCPLAGSAARSADPAEDRRRAEALQASAKDQVEHAIVVDAIAESLRPLCRTLEVPRRPELVATPTMWHLATPIAGTVADAAITALDLALALHPTPAICGAPAAAAHAEIGRIEGFDRGFYSGFVGWCDARGDGEWAIAIRCAEVDAAGARLFAGGGIVAGSDPAAELAETSAKFRTMVDAIDEAVRAAPVRG
ncbi:isochorismate synthase [Tomitella fengzijianii]|uniref:isochorismate synthase n=2 Tax=Tomitella fengzijianii TaxID=2597660 RepID=A0A516X8P7_9ACTN|nr:isochorismate synthase [Tomitella fengzijianii]